MKNETKQTAVEWLASELSNHLEMPHKYFIEILDQAKEMEKEQHERFNKFLNDEIKLGISDKETVKRIQWYYNTYFNETYGGNK